MKKIARLMTALALMTYAFTSCEDIPAPYNTDGPQSDVIKVDPTGEGTKASPYNVSGIIDYTKDLANGASTAEVYVTGYVVNIREYQQQYNSLNYDIADDVEGKSEYFYVYGGKGLNKATFNSMADLPIGSKVTVCGKVKNHNGVIEFDSQNYIVEMDGQTSGGSDPSAEAKGTGTLEDPFNAVAATVEAQKLASGEVSQKAYYIKGKVSKIATDKDKNPLNFDQGTYGNASFYISDDGEAKNDFYCYRVLYLGNKKWTSGAGDVLKVGDDVIVCAKLTMYNSTPETQQNEGYLYSLNGKTEGAGGGSEVTPGTPSGDGSEASPFNVAAAVAKCKEVGTTASAESYYIKGIADADYTVSSYKNVEINIVDKEGASEKFKVFRVKDKDGKGIKEGYKIAKGATIIVYGPVVNYQGNTPETATGSYLVSVNGQAPELDDGTSGGGETGGGTSNADITASFGDLDCSNIAEIKLSDGTTLSLNQEGGKNPPIYHEGTKMIRMYAQNSLTVTASKKIDKIEFTYDGSYKGNDAMYGEAGSNKITPTKDNNLAVFANVNNNSLKVVNDFEGNSGGTQFRISKIAITYAK